MSAQQLVGAGGAGLLVLDMWTGDGRKAISAGLLNSSATAEQQQTAHRELVKLGAAALFVIVATIAAGVSSQWASIMSLVIVGLFILWAINRYSAK